jgi:DNA-binding transcriptional MerR regulator
MTAAVAYLSADVLAETGASPSYLAFLVRVGIICPTKYRNGHTNLFTEQDIRRICWALEHRGHFSIKQMRERLAIEVAA